MTNFFLTLVANDTPLTEKTINIVGDFIDFQWLKKDKAADIRLNQPLGRAAINYLRTQLENQKIDVFHTASDNRRKKLLLADMDSTIVTGETLDELAAYAGIKDKIAAITARAMNGELDFHAALRERVGLLTGLSDSKLQETLDETHLTSGAQTFVQTMKKHGAHCVLVSGGFTFFTQAIANQTGFDNHHGNTLDIQDGKLTGKVIDPILDKESKRAFLNEYVQQRGITLEDTLTIGDGANDLPMLQAAGLGIGFHAKPTVVEQLDNMIRFGDLTSALYAQGYREDEFA